LALLAADETRVARNLIYALSLDDGSTLPGWPADVSVKVPEFDDLAQAQRGALTLLSGRVYIPYGSHTDCGSYRGFLVGISTSDPDSVSAWRTKGLGCAIWAPSGVASDGASLFVATANGIDPEWAGANAIIRLEQGPTFSESPTDYFAALDWPRLDELDLDLGGSGVTLFELPEAGLQLAAALGKDGKMYLANRSNLGGIGGALLTQTVSDLIIITAPSAYRTDRGTFVAFTAYGHGIGCPGSENIVNIQVNPTSPLSISTAWCAYAPGAGSTMVTTTDGRAESIVWVVGAKVGSLLYGIDGDTGALIAQSEGADGVIRYMAPVAAKGRIYVAGTNWLYAFSLK
jgi:hypothetical protein